MKKLLKLGVIKESAHEEVVSLVFLVKKADSSIRTSLNLKHFNKSVEYKHL